MANREPVKGHIPSALRKRVRQYAAKKGVSESSITHAALSRYLDDTNDAPVLLRKMDRLERSVERVHRDSDVFAEAFAVFVKIWLAHTPRLADSEKRLAEHSALQRFAEYHEYVAEKVAEGGTFIADLVRGNTGDDELAPTAAPTNGELG
jgi:hypothetical protein